MAKARRYRRFGPSSISSGRLTCGLSSLTVDQPDNPSPRSWSPSRSRVSTSAKMAVRNFLLLAAFGNLGSVLAAPSAPITIMGAQPGYPASPDSTPYCTWWWDNDGSIPCELMAEAWEITWDDFVRWVSVLSQHPLDWIGIVCLTRLPESVSGCWL